MTLTRLAFGVSRRTATLLFSAGFVVGAACCAVAGVLALYGPSGPGSAVLTTMLIVGLAVTLGLVGMAAARFTRTLVMRKEGAPAPRLHFRFVALFSFAAVAPSVLMATFFGVLLSRGLETWFGEQVEASVQSAYDTAQFYVEQIAEQARLDALVTAGDLSLPENRAAFEENPEALPEFLVRSAIDRAFLAVYLVDSTGEPLVSYEHPAAPEYRPPTQGEFQTAQGDVAVDVDQQAESLRFLVRLEGYPDAYLYGVPDVNPDTFSALRAASGSTTAFREASEQRRRIEIFFALIFLEATLLILAGAVWVALSAASRVATPIGRLVEAADRIRRGDLAARVDAGEEHDEVAALGRAFNLMTDQIERQRGELIDANAESEGRRRLIEAVLLGVSAGVLSVDSGGVIRLANRSGSELLGVSQPDLRDAALADVAPSLAEIAGRARARPGDTVEAQIELARGDTALVLNVRAEADPESDGRVVLTFDDITRLIAAQRNAAWRDVARRIAHEIKNPLTPIQLSAERLRRRYRPAEDEKAEIFDRCTDTIIRQVSDIGRMVDEFSAFARMPTPRIEEASLQALAQETAFARRVAHPDIQISLEAPDTPIRVLCDERLATQAAANLLKNAAESIAAQREREDPGGKRPGRIDVRVFERGGQGVIEIRDNGAGWPAGARERLTEPYMTTREKGTGLGLAIVQRIMEDHGGALELDVPDDDGDGAVVRLAFPLAHAGRAAEAAE